MKSKIIKTLTILLLSCACVNSWAGSFSIASVGMTEGANQGQPEPALEIDDALINAIICVESNWDANAYNSKTGCRGLMQISEAVFKEYLNEQCTFQAMPNSAYSWHIDYDWKPIIIKGNLLELYNADLNLRISYWYLNRLKDHYIPPEKYSIELLLACYHLGPTAMKEKFNWDWRKSRDAKRYISKVMAIYKSKN